MEETTSATDRDLWMALSCGVRAVVRKHRVPQRDGDDVAQDVLVRVLMRKERAHLADIERYAMRAARNNCLTYWRNSRRRAGRIRTGIALDELGQDAKFAASGKRQAASGKREVEQVKHLDARRSEGARIDQHRLLPSLATWPRWQPSRRMEFRRNRRLRSLCG